jgi:peptidoglycan/xylan/chitin deacetylase (PgdA/CDA1 family)
MSFMLTGCSGTPTAPVSAPTLESIPFTNTTVSLTFDDGDADNYGIRPVLKENGLHATFYIVSGFTGTDGYLTAEQLRGLYEDGHEIGGHSLSHVNLTDVRGPDLRREVCQNRLDLLAQGFEVVSFAYPFGHYDEEARQAVIDCGYNSARSVTDGPDTVPPGDPYTLQAMPYIVSNVRLPKLIRYITGVENEGGGWVIFIFHHVCDDCDEFSVDLETFTEFAHWLKKSQANGLVVKTVAEVVGGDLKPGVEP